MKNSNDIGYTKFKIYVMIHLQIIKYKIDVGASMQYLEFQS